MFFRINSATTATLLFMALNTIVVTASDWKPSGKPASSITQVVFEEPATGPDFESEEASFKPPILPPIPDDEATEADPDDAHVEQESLKPADSDDVPDFAPEEASPAETSSASGENGSKSESDETSSDDAHSATGKAKLKVLDATEEADELFNPKEWFGRWNRSSLDWVLRNGDNGIGFLSLMGDAPSWNFDLDAREEGLEMDFGSGIHFVDGPGHIGSDLPPRLFDIFWNARFVAETDYGIGIEANFQMGLFTDFEDSVREGWRFPGRVLAYSHLWTAEDPGRVVGGFEYLDLEQTEILPAGGIIYKPTPDTQVDLYFPRPQIRLRVDQEESGDQWLYFRGEYHGSAWAIERNTGNADVVSLTEYRATIGLETIPSDKEESSSFFEVGFLFNRDLEYRSGVGNFQPDDTVVLRWGSRY